MGEKDERHERGGWEEKGIKTKRKRKRETEE